MQGPRLRPVGLLRGDRPRSGDDGDTKSSTTCWSLRSAAAPARNRRGPVDFRRARAAPSQVRDLQRLPALRHRPRPRWLGREVLPRIDEAVALQPVLLVVELAVAPLERQQLLVGAALDDLAALE